MSDNSLSKCAKNLVSQIFSKEKPLRVQIELTSILKDTLVRVKKRMDLNSNSETLMKAIKLADWYFYQKDQGNKILVENKDGSLKEIEFIWR